MSTRFGIDVGGTFTDLVFFDERSGRTIVGKAPSTPASPDQGVENVVRANVPSEALADASHFLHGTTVGLNALLERKGAVMGLLATSGFRDVLELRRGMRDALYDVFWKAPAPLIPRRLRLPVTERTRKDGTVETPLDPGDVAAAARLFADEGVDCVAIVFINSHANPEHELLAERLLREGGFEGDISLSHQVSGELREYERTSTTVVDGYIRPAVASYLARLDGRLADIGFDGDSLVTRSGGGALSFDEAALRPVETVMSGPAAGAMACARLCRDIGLARGIGADVGGTSFDTCLITEGRARTTFEGEIGGMPLQTPWIDVRSIGAGGGSIAYEEGGLLHVGPRSAGSVPGPACYGRGGSEPTVTDAAAMLGMLGRGELASGLRLDIPAAREAVGALGAKLGLEPDETARGILTIVTAQMANAIRSITLEVGEDPRAAALIPFGGAGPLFGTLLARELGIRSIVVPQHAGGFSAWGLLQQDLTRSAARTLLRDLDEPGLAAASDLLVELSAVLAARAGGDAGEIGATLELRYAGQEYSLAIEPALEAGRVVDDPAALEGRFVEEYERVYGHRMSTAVQIVNVRATARTPLGEVAADAVRHDGAAGRAEVVRAFSFTTSAWTDFRLIPRRALRPAETVLGPAIVIDETETTYIDARFEVEVHDSGALIMTDTEVPHGDR